MIAEALAGSAAICHASAAAAISAGILSRTTLNEGVLPTVTIVVPARNEEQNLSRLFSSLRALDYPAELLDLILVNDASTDDTRLLAESLIKSLPFPARVVEASHDPEETLPATKTLPLAQGLDMAQGEIVLMTDGDCSVPPQWVRGFVAEFSADTGMVCGLTLPDYSSGRIIRKLEAVDWSLLLGVCCGMTRLGLPLALIGNNYAVRRASYHEIGTFRGIAHNRIDDIALFRAIADSGTWKIAFTLTDKSLNITLPTGGFLDIVRQRYRWLEGIGAVTSKGKLLFAFGVFTHLFWPLSFLLGLPIGLFCTAGVLGGDWLVMTSTLLKLKRKNLGIAVLAYPVFAFAYGWLLLWMMLVRPEIRWRGRKLA